MPTPSKFAQALASGSFLVTCELDPPKGIDLSLLDDKLSKIKEVVNAVVVADNPKGRMSMAPMAPCHYLLAQGLEPIMTLTCRDRNRLALESDLLAAAALGIHNILAVAGDYITWGDHPESAPVYDLDSVQLLWALSLLNHNQDLAGQPVQGSAPNFTYGATVTLTAKPVLPLVLKFKKKLTLDPHFFISHPIFDLSSTEDFFKELREIKTPLLASVCLLTEEQVRSYSPGRYPGLVIPMPILEKFQSWKSGEFLPRLVEYTAGLINAVRKDARFRGVHLMLQDQEDKIRELI